MKTLHIISTEKTHKNRDVNLPNSWIETTGEQILNVFLQHACRDVSSFITLTHFRLLPREEKNPLHLDLWLQCTEKGQRSRVQKWSSEIMQCACVQGDAGQGAISAPLGS